MLHGSDPTLTPRPTARLAVNERASGYSVYLTGPGSTAVAAKKMWFSSPRFDDRAMTRANRDITGFREQPKSSGTEPLDL